MKKSARIAVSAASLAAAGIIGFCAGRASYPQEASVAAVAAAEETEGAVSPEAEKIIGGFSIGDFIDEAEEPDDSVPVPETPAAPDQSRIALKEKGGEEPPAPPAPDAPGVKKPEGPKPAEPKAAEEPKKPEAAEKPAPPEKAKEPADAIKKADPEPLKPKGPGEKPEEPAKAPAKPL